MRRTGNANNVYFGSGLRWQDAEVSSDKGDSMDLPHKEEGAPGLSLKETFGV